MRIIDPYNVIMSSYYSDGALHLQVQVHTRMHRSFATSQVDPVKVKRPRGRPRKQPKPPVEDLVPPVAKHEDMRFSIEIDAEWWTEEPSGDGRPPLSLPPRFITLQIREFSRFTTHKFCLEHPMWKQLNPSELPVKIKNEGRRAQPILISWTGETPIALLLGKNFRQRQAKPEERLDTLPKFRLTITMFYSFADVVALLGLRLSNILVEYLSAGKAIRILKHWAPLPHVIIQKTPDGDTIERQLVVNIRDLFPLEYESLKSTADAYNVPMPDKDSMADYKSMMNVAYSDPDLRSAMIEYALGDLVLADLWEAYKHNYQELCETSGVEPKMPPPSSKGAFVAHLFAQVLNSTINIPHDFHKIFDIPAGRSSAEAPYSAEIDHGCMHTSVQASSSESDLQFEKETSALQVQRTITTNKNSKDRKSDKRGPSITHLLRHYGCRHLAKSEDSLTKQFLAIVHGGRVNNENPLVVRRTGLVISMDIVSCYGQALEHLYMPIGHPAVFYYVHHKSSEWPTLRTFIDECRSELVEGCWYIVVDTCGERLTTPQNILYSKYFNNDQPEILDKSKEPDDFKEDLAHVKGDFMLLENEVRNGILTHYSLSVIEHCASNQELNELFLKLRVKAAMIYPKSLCIEYNGPESVDKWIEASRNHSGKLDTWGNLKEHGLRDTRVGPWLKYPLGTFISPLLAKRKSLKSMMKQQTPDSPEWRRLNAAQLSVKKVVNTLYGTMASIYFSISSPCVANNVTDRARSACWLMSVAGAGLTSITDGCESMLNEVRYSKGHVPSLATAARLHMPHLLNERTRARHWTAPLGSAGDKNRPWAVDVNGMITGPGIDQPIKASAAVQLIDEMYDQHIRAYFHHTKPLPSWFDKIKFECKLIGRDIALHGAANYAINRLPMDIDTTPLIKARGHRLNATHYNPTSGSKMDSPMRIMMLHRLNDQAMKLGQSAIYYKPASVADYKRRKLFREEGGLPGYSIAKNTNIRLITSTEFNYPSLACRRAWTHYYAYLIRKYGLGLEALYIRYDDDRIIDQMTVEELESAKLDIQTRIYSEEHPSSQRVGSSKAALLRARYPMGSSPISPVNDHEVEELEDEVLHEDEDGDVTNKKNR